MVVVAEIILNPGIEFTIYNELLGDIQKRGFMIADANPSETLGSDQKSYLVVANSDDDWRE